MDAALASELTTGERCEHLLGVIACAMTRRRPTEVMPWLRGNFDG